VGVVGQVSEWHSWFLTYIISTMHSHMNIKNYVLCLVPLQKCF
jgi:hypothetical protein